MYMIPIQTKPTRTWFLSHGFSKVPPEVIDGKLLYEHPDGYFINACGHKPVHCYKPGRAALQGRIAYPKLRYYGNRDCHYLTACTFCHIPDRSKGEVVDHINGDVLNYSRENIRVVHKSINNRDGGFLRKLRNKGVNPTYYATPFLLRFFDRMAEFKSSHTPYQYQKLSRTDLLNMLVNPEFTVGDPNDRMEYEMTHHMEY